MATENRGVMVYLPPDVEEYITNFCTEYNIVRKDKEGNTLPSLGTGVVTYLKSKILGELPDNMLTRPSKVLSNGLSREEVLDLIKEYSTSQSPSTGLSKDEVLTAIEERISTLSVPSGLDGEVLTPLNRSIEGLRETLNELESYMMGNFEGLRESVKKLEESQLKGAGTIPSGEKHSQTDLFEGDSLARPTPSTAKTSIGQMESQSKENEGKPVSWAKFHGMVGLESPPRNQVNKAMSEVALSKAREMGMTDWVFNSDNKNFRQTTPKHP